MQLRKIISVAIPTAIPTAILTLCVGSLWATDACSLLTPAQVSAVLGVQVGPGERLVPSNTSMCGWSEPGHKGLSDKKVVLSLYTQLGTRTPMDRFNTAKTPVQGVTKDPVSGIGDEAFYSTASGLGTTLVVRKGNTPFHVAVHGFPVEQVKEKEKTLAGEILSKL
ncbi:MAG: hypothetical protein JO187_02815 [Acidobacteria bacterium]|nr:hypothetical protein [Acidobacteriota bacterium]